MPRLAAHLLLDLLDRVHEVVGFVGRSRGERETDTKSSHSSRTGRASLAPDGVVRTLAKLLVGERARAARDADHAVVLGHETRAWRLKSPGSKLTREVARRAEEHDHVVLGRRRPVALCAKASTCPVSARYAAAGSFCQKIALPATSKVRAGQHEPDGVLGSRRRHRPGRTPSPATASEPIRPNASA